MSCGCGGKCCGQSKGLGFLWSGGDDAWEPEYPYADGGGSDYWGFGDSFWWGDYGPDLGLPNWQDTRDFGGYYVDPNTGAILFSDSERFLPSSQQPSGNSNWQGLLDWWAELTGGLINSGPGGSGNDPALLGYCPGGTYHPRNDPYSCVPFPPETPEYEKQQRAAAAHKAAQDALKAAAKAQQTAQGCPPNTGLVKNAQGQCVCPPPSVFSKTYGKCVLASQLTAKDKEDAQAPDWLKWAIAAGIVVVGVKVLQGGKGK